MNRAVNRCSVKTIALSVCRLLGCLFLLAACESDESAIDRSTEISTAGAGTTKEVNTGKVLSRLISVKLEVPQPHTYTPFFADRAVVAEPVYSVPVTTARGQAVMQGVSVIYVGDDCISLQARYDLLDCVEEETAEFKYGEAEATVTTNFDGYTDVYLGDAEKYRLRVVSFKTAEDPKCFWGGAKTVVSTDTSVAIPMLVFCE